MPEPPPGRPATFADVLEQELAAVAARRRGLFGPGDSAPEAGDDGPPVPPLERQRRRALRMGLVGLSFSGGGIRSGTFAVGFLQGLARLRLLRLFDYLSTVSGGGYAGAWLAAWVYREGLRDGCPARTVPAPPPPDPDDEPPAPDEGPLANVERQLDPSRVEQSAAVRTVTVPDEAGAPPNPDGVEVRLGQVLDEEPGPVYHLRAFSNYLAPRPGLFSGDTWTLLVIYLRNTLVNLTVLVPAVAAVVFLSRLADWGYARGAAAPWPFLVTAVLAAAALVAGGGLAANRARLHRASHPGGPAGPADRSSEMGGRAFLWLIVAPTVVAAALAAWAFGIDPTAPDDAGGPLRHWGYAELRAFYDRLPEAALGRGDLRLNSFGRFALTFAALAPVVAGFGLLNYRRAGIGRRWWVAALSTVVLGTANGAFLYLALDLALWPLARHPLALATVGPPLLTLALILSDFVEMALFSRWLSDYEREWRSRLNSALLMAALAWLVFFAATRYLPLALGWLVAQTYPAVTPALLASWALTTVGSLRAARQHQAAPADRPPGWGPRLLIAVGPPVFLTGLLALVAELTRAALGLGPNESPAAGLWGAVLLWAAGCAAAVLALSWFIDLNQFSMHALYGNRLTRCYLGASRRQGTWGADPERDGRMRRAGPPWDWFWGPGVGGAPTGAAGGTRRENPVSGFDPQDDFALSELRVVWAGAAPASGRPYGGPYPLFNAALNLVAGTELAVQDRKADSFVLTPHFCGSKPTGYAPTPAGADGANLTLGRAVTISGAALDPNMSAYQTPPLTALLTVFNLRLGWWLENPLVTAADGRAWAAAAPRYGMLPQIVRELFGLTDEKGRYVHLSDGGHFENLGAYELIRRRCRFVVVCEAGEDPHADSENLARLVRLVRADFGIRVEIDTAPVRRGPGGLSPWHVAVGTIRYDDVDDQAVAGTLVFVRTSLTGDEPTDVRQYADTHPEFPHTPTRNQFFGADQFESYRALGDHVATSVFAEAAEGFDWSGLSAARLATRTRGLFARVRNRWFPPPPDFGRDFTAVGRLCADRLAELRTDPRLAELTRDIYPELDLLAPADFERERAGLLGVHEILATMELAWLGVHLDGYYSHPMNRGWMNAFRRWTGAGRFERFWPVLRGGFCKDFVRFCEKTLNLAPVTVVPRPLPPDAGDAPVESLEREFLREWGQVLAHPARGAGRRVRSLLGAVQGARADAAQHRDEPLAWLLTLARWGADGGREPLPELAHYPVGLLAVYHVEGGEYEAVFWVRGPYRSQGLGRQTLQFAFDGVRLHALVNDRLRRRHPDGPLRVIARYPDAGSAGADKLQRALWLNFLHDYEFRRSRRGRHDGFLTLECRL